MASIDQQFIEYIVKSLVSHPDDVAVERTIDEKGVLLKLTVNQEDLGRVIGKRGSTAQSIRTLLRALGTKNDARYNLKIIDPEGDSRPSPDENKSEAKPETETAPAKASAQEPQANDTESNPEDVSASVEPEAEPETEKPTDTLADKTRKELAELDDLDI